MTDRPILFSAPMIRALLDGRKTQTRRILKPQPLMGYTPDVTASKGVRFAKGDRLWVRETFSFDHRWTGLPPRDVQWEEPVWYWADGDPTDGDWTKPKPGIHMPRWASRLTLTVTDVRAQRLQEISEADAIAEGAPAVISGQGVDGPVKTHRTGFVGIWNKINGNWLDNPWVVAITFVVEQRNTLHKE